MLNEKITLFITINFVYIGSKNEYTISENIFYYDDVRIHVHDSAPSQIDKLQIVGEKNCTNLAQCEWRHY